METLFQFAAIYFIGWLMGVLTMGFIVVTMIDAWVKKAKAKIQKTGVQELNPHKWE